LTIVWPARRATDIQIGDLTGARDEALSQRGQGAIPHRDDAGGAALDPFVRDAIESLKQSEQPLPSTAKA
jgi:hypothetical protein